MSIWASVGGGLLSGGLQYLGARESNAENREQATNANSVNQAEAAYNRQFQEQMSNTSYRRAKNDLIKAGFNPLLALPGGASTPSGSAGSGAIGNKMENELSGAVTSALEAYNMSLATKKQKAEIGLMEKQGQLTEAQKNKAAMETQVIKKDLPKSDFINSIYNTFKPFVQKATEAIRTAPKDPVWNNEIKEFHNKYKKINNSMK